ncbi:MAG: membrane protein insertase YidC [Rhizomicrobium sp.]
MTDNKNFLIAMALSFIVLMGWMYFIGQPQMKAENARQALLAHQEKAKAAPVARPQARTDNLGGAGRLSREAALKTGGARVVIDTPTLDGSLLLKGARFDDLRLKKYRETTNRNSPEIDLLSPNGTHYPYYAVFGWVAASGSAVSVPNDETTAWKLMHGNTLTPSSPVTLQWDNQHGLIFTRTISVDKNYMFTVDDSVANKSGARVEIYPYAYTARIGVPDSKPFWVLHEGFVGVANGSADYKKYADIKVGQPESLNSGGGGWIGITDKYWMAAVIPPQNAPFVGQYVTSSTDGLNSYQSNYRLLNSVAVAPGQTATVSQRLFAGAKVVNLINNYEGNGGVQRFDLAIDWGWFPFLTKPIFLLLDFYYRIIGNFGFAILLLTVTIKLIFFPLADASYRSMSRMKKLQPEMEKIKARFADDKVKQQQETMELYRREKVNPVSGCLPTLVQIPVFFCLYKVLVVTIEMRQAPFFGWIHDLSAPDPTSFFNLFGLIPWSMPAALPGLAEVPLFGGPLQSLILTLIHIGIWPFLMGITQWLQTKMNPAPADPVTARMMSYMPIVFTMMMAGFPAGLVIYWTWNNLLSVGQQYVMMRRQGVEVHLFKNIRLPAFVTRGRKSTAPGE